MMQRLGMGDSSHAQMGSRGQEDGAALMQRRVLREERRRREQRRLAMAAAALGLLGVGLVGVGIAAAGRGKAAAQSNAVGAAPESPGESALAPAKIAPGITTAAAPPAESTQAPEPVSAVKAEVATKRTVRSKPRTARKRARSAAVARQHFSIEIGSSGYEPSVIRASSKSPISLSVGKGEGCAAGFLMPSLGIEKDNTRGRIKFSLGRLEPGTYRFTCGMEMVEGQLVVR